MTARLSDQPERPDRALHALGDVQRLSIRTDLDAVGRPHARGDAGHSAVGRNPPELAGTLVPVRVAGVQHPIGSDRQVVRLMHAAVVGVDGERAAVGIDLEDVVPDIVRHVHLAARAEPDPVAHAALRQLQVDFTRAVRSDPADRALSLVVDGVDVARDVAGRPLDPLGERPLGRQRRCDEDTIARTAGILREDPWTPRQAEAAGHTN